MARPDARPDARHAAESRLAAAPAGGGAWLRAAREAARERLLAMGLPGRRDEYWRYTDPADLTSAEAPAAAPPRAADGAEPFAAAEPLRLVFVDGLFDPAASDPPELAGVQIERLAEAAPRDLHWARDLFGAIEARGQTPVPRPLAALNTALAADGLLLRVSGRAERPVALVRRQAAEGSDVMLHHCIRIEPGAELTLLESGPGGARTTDVLEVDVGDGGRFHHVRLQGRDHGGRVAAHLFARVGAAAQLRAFTLTADGPLTRNEAYVELAGAGGLAHLAGAALGDGAFHHDDTVVLRHIAPGCESRQVFKKVLKNGAAGVFQGKIHVLAQAQKTDGYQIAQALLLDEASQFLAKPELEIYADDVKCSHGSTVGAIDPVALYYLRSRGVPRARAEALLVQAFLAEAVDEIADPTLAEDIRARLEAWVARHSG